MTWVRIDDDFAQHPKVVAAGPLAMAMQVAGLCYCNKNLTDGFIPWSVARNLLSWKFLGESDEAGRRVYTVAVTCGMSGDDVTGDLVISMLKNGRMWDEVDGGFMIHDYLDYNPSKNEVLAARSAISEQRSLAGKASVDSRKRKYGTAQPNNRRTGRSGSVRVDNRTDSERASNPIPTPVPIPDQESTCAPVPVARVTKPTTTAREDYIEGIAAKIAAIATDEYRMACSCPQKILRKVAGRLVKVAKGDGYGRDAATNTAEVLRLVRAYYTDLDEWLVNRKHPLSDLLTQRVDKYRRPVAGSVKPMDDGEVK